MTVATLAAACLLALASGASAELHPKELAGMNTVHKHGDAGVASLHTARPIAEAVLGSEDARAARASDDATSQSAGGDLPQAELGAASAADRK